MIREVLVRRRVFLYGEDHCDEKCPYWREVKYADNSSTVALCILGKTIEVISRDGIRWRRTSECIEAERLAAR